MRHRKQQKGLEKERTSQITLRRPWPLAFSVDQEYSSASCSPAELTSAYPDKVNIIPTNNFKPKSYPHFSVFGRGTCQPYS